MLFHLDPPQQFSFKPADWPNWRVNFERFRIASGLNKEDDYRQICTLIYVMGPQANDIRRTFTFEATEDRTKYATILSKFETYFFPPRNVIRERYIFNIRNQNPGETGEQFIAALHKLSETCGFGVMKDELIRDRIIAGIADSELSRKLRYTAKLTLCKAIEMVRAYENAPRRTRSIQVVVQNEIAHYNKHTCSDCGGDKHRPEICPARNIRCHKCRLIGHYTEQCNVLAVANLNQVRFPSITASKRNK